MHHYENAPSTVQLNLNIFTVNSILGSNDNLLTQFCCIELCNVFMIFFNTKTLVILISSWLS